MSHSLTHESRNVLALAQQAARSFKHAYVGTEHILLGLLEDSSCGIADLLAAFGITAEQVRAEIERLITSGAEPIKLQTLPLTPRSKHVIERAAVEARMVNETCIAPEHLLLGLMHEEHGVACQVLRNLGIRTDELRAEVLRIRLAQMKIVERAVRPVRAGTPRKRKMREELLAHLAAIYDEEFARLRDPVAALEAAARRFGRPTELARELESALPFHERINHFVERWVGWRAPESAAKYSARQAILTFCILAVVSPLVLAGVFLGYGWIDDVQTLARVVASILIIAPPAHFLITLASIKMRDALWGVFGSRRSLLRAFAFELSIGLVIAGAFFAFSWAAHLDWNHAVQSLPFCGIAGIVGAFSSIVIVRLLGEATIRDTYWALLDTEPA